MKLQSLPSTVHALLALFCLTSSLHAQDKGLYTEKYIVSPTFLAKTGPSAEPVKKTPVDILKNAGVTFEPGADAIFNPGTSQLIVRNTRDQLELVEAFIGYINKKAEKQLRIRVEWIELSHANFTKLMDEYNSTNSSALNSSNDGPLRAKLKKMIEEDEARIIDTKMVMSRSGQRSKVESITEVIYPTAYKHPTTEKAAGKKSKSPVIAANKDGESQKAGESPVLLPVAAAYETRTVGTTLEVDPVLGSDERTVDLSLSPEIVYHVGHEEYGFYKDGESEVGAKMPLFYTMKLTTQVTMIVGEYLFAGVQSPFDMEAMKADRDRKVMIFLKTDLLYAGLPFNKKKTEPQGKK